MDGQTVARAKDDNLPSLKELIQTAPHLQTSSNALRTEPTIQHVEHPSFTGAGIEFDRINPKLGERFRGNPDHPMVLVDELNAGVEAERASSNVNTGDAEWIARLHNLLPTSKFASAPSKSIDASNLSYDVELPLELGPCEQHSVPSTPAQEQALPHGKTYQQNIEVVTQSMYMDSALRFFPQPSDSTELEEELGLAALEQRQEELRPSAVVNQQDLVKIVNVDDSGKMNPTQAPEALSAAQPKIPEIIKNRCRLRGIRTRPFAGRQAQITQYRVVWGESPDKSDSWFNYDDIQMSMSRPPCKLDHQNLALQKEIQILKVCGMRSSPCKGNKSFEYLVDASGLDASTWITENQLQISLGPMLVAEPQALTAPSSYFSSQAQSDVHLRHSATPNSDKHCHVSRVSSPADPALGGEPASRKRGHQHMYTEINKETYNSVNTDNNRNASETDDEDPRPAKRRKSGIVSAVTPPLHLLRSSPAGSPLTTRPEIDEAQTYADDERSSTSIIQNVQQRALRTSRSPSTTVEAAPVDEDQEWPLQAFLKRTSVKGDRVYSLEFKLSLTSQHLNISINPAALDIYSSNEVPAKVPIHHSASAHSKVHHVPLKSNKMRAGWTRWTEEEDTKLVTLKADGESWEDIHAALPGRSIGSIKVRLSTKFKR